MLACCARTSGSPEQSVLCRAARNARLKFLRSVPGHCLWLCKDAVCEDKGLLLASDLLLLLAFGSLACQAIGFMNSEFWCS